MITSNVDEFARALARRAQNLDRANAVATRKAGQHVRGAIEGETRRATGGDMRLSGARNHLLGIRMKMGTSPDSAELKATGGWPLIEKSLKAHRIPRVRGRRSRRVVKVLKIPGVGYRASAQHPGVRRTSGPWKRGSDRGLAGVQRIYRQAVREVIG